MSNTKANLNVEKFNRYWRITFSRTDENNALNRQTLIDLNSVLDEAEGTPECCALILQGKEGLFCTGLDFKELVESHGKSIISPNESDYMSTLKRLSTTGKVVIAVVDGVVIAGGVGLAAASDIIIASTEATFSLPEVLWGLIPACVIPFLVRRIGPHKTMMLAMTAKTVDVDEAYRIGLVDTLSSNPSEDIRKYLIQFSRLDANALKALKTFSRSMWIIDEEMEKKAVEEINQLITRSDTFEKIQNYIDTGKYPWE